MGVFFGPGLAAREPPLGSSWLTPFPYRLARLHFCSRSGVRVAGFDACTIASDCRRSTGVRLVAVIVCVCVCVCVCAALKLPLQSGSALDRGVNCQEIRDHANTVVDRRDRSSGWQSFSFGRASWELSRGQLIQLLT